MRREEVIKAKINHLTKVRERINKRISEVKDGQNYPDMSMDNKKIYGVLMSWWDRVGIQLNALQYALSDAVELGSIDRKVYGLGHREIMGKEDLFREEPLEFVMKKDGLYLSGFMTGYEGGREKKEFFFNDRTKAHVFKWCERDNDMIKELMYQRGAVLEYVWEDKK